MEMHGLQDNFARQQILENELDHLSDKVEKLCEQLDKSLPLLTEINYRMHDDIARRATLEARVTTLVNNIKDLSFIQTNHQILIDAHDKDIRELTQQIVC